MMIFFLAFVILWSPPVFTAPPECASSSSNPPSYEKLYHIQGLVDDISTLYLNDRFSDVVLVVDNVRLQAHRLVLATRSNYFGGLLYGGYEESQQTEVKISGISVTSFKVLLEYIYTGQMNLSLLEDEVILELFDVSYSFGFPILQAPLSNYLGNNLNVHNACLIFVLMRLHQQKALVKDSLSFIDNHGFDILQSDGFLTLPHEALQEVLIRDSFYADELDIFRAVGRWINKNQYNLNSSNKIKVLSVVRYPLMTDEELSEVRGSGFVSSDIISDAIQFRKASLPHNLPFRGQLKPNVNLVRQGLLDSTKNDGGPLIKLDYPSIINYIRLVCHGQHLGSYSYYIEVSMDKHKWVRVIDHSEYICRSFQRLWIHPRSVRYIRIISTKTNCKFFEIMYNAKEMHKVKIENGLVAPKHNVATLAMDATVIKSANLFYNYSLLDGVFKDYIRYHRYTWHRLGKGCIMVQLSQPYILSSMRMLLWDGDDIVYGYTIEVSLKNKDWEMIVDKSKEYTRSWQVLQFNPRPIVFIRITGVYNSAGDDFRCVYFEAPAIVRLDPNVVEDDRAITNNRENNETVIMSEASAQSPAA